MIVVVDYGMGNLRSVAKAFERLGLPVRVSQDSREIEQAEKLVLPGVGAFPDAVENLDRFKLKKPVESFLRSGKPFLGICLGLQLLFTESEEGKGSLGFNVFAGKVRRFPENGLKVPHIGWNQIARAAKRPAPKECPLLEGIPDGSYFYFVHSYYGQPADPAVTVAKTEYGTPFSSILWKGNIFATQFHPEKSQALGLKILENFGRV